MKSNYKKYLSDSCGEYSISQEKTKIFLKKSISWMHIDGGQILNITETKELVSFSVRW